ncbi:MAG: methyltransferase domain-containing protein [Actinomycetota bacterium]|nr:methyltransferase domain-containing protein [Actinomycetota bacterium]MDQ3086030.1 methyltransferase domain-containing protein [Actinomycetota bacterium]
MTTYEVFAPFYDQVMGDRGREGAYLRELIQKHCPEAATVLELACGTGAILEQLHSRYEVSGLDASRRMLDIAAQKLPQARLFREDMTRFDLGETFDVVLCVFDSINHLLAFADWEAVFHCAYQHLTERGVFIFDVNTERKLASFASAPPWTQWFGDDSLLLIEVRDEGSGVYAWKLRIFEHRSGSTYRLHVEDIREATFPLERIKEALTTERFGRVWVYDAERQRPTSRSLRLHFVCRH